MFDYTAVGDRGLAPSMMNQQMGHLRSFRDGAGTYGGAFDAALGLSDTARSHTVNIGKGVQKASNLLGNTPHVSARSGRMAMQALRHPGVATALKYAPIAATGLAAGDVIFGDDSLGNKGMDAAMMTAGGFIGSAVPVLGTGLGIAAGKATSDGLQWLFGDKKTAEQRQMELALTSLQRGNY